LFFRPYIGLSWFLRCFELKNKYFGQTTLSPDFLVTTVAGIKAKLGDTSADFFSKNFWADDMWFALNAKKKGGGPIALVG